MDLAKTFADGPTKAIGGVKRLLGVAPQRRSNISYSERRKVSSTCWKRTTDRMESNRF